MLFTAGALTGAAGSAKVLEDFSFSAGLLSVFLGLSGDALSVLSGVSVDPDPSDSPVSVDKRRSRRVRLAHLSWSRILTEAVIESEHRGVDDPEQARILDELIAYLDNEKSGASEEY